MKRKQILARAITLGLLLAMPCGAWAESIDEYKFSGSKTLTDDTRYTGGLLIGKDASIIGNNKSLDIQGFFYCKGLNNFNDTISGDTIDRTNWDDINNYYPYLNNEVGLANLGSITGVNVLKFSSEEGDLKNRGTIEATTLDLTDISYNGVHNDTYGKMVVTNIEGNFFSDEDIGEFYETTFSNDGEVIINNSIKTDVTNNTSGVIIYKGTKAISGNLQNAGKIIITSDNLKITDGRLTVQGTSSQLLGANETYLQSLEVVDDGIDIGSSWQSGSLIVDGTITTKFVNNYGTVQGNNLKITGYMDDEDVYGGTNYSGATMLISNSINLASDSIFKNKGNILFVGESAEISGNGIINNIFDKNVIGIIAKNVDGDKISNLTIEGTLNNSGIVAAETLNVANGVDAADSKGFNVDNLNILGNDSQGTNSFALQKDNYTFTSVGVGENASLTAAGSLGVSGAMALQDGASVETLAENGSITAGSVSVGEGGSVKTSALSAVKNDAVTGADGSIVTGTGSTITATTVGATTLTNDGKIIASGDVTVAEKLTNTGTLEASKVSAQSLDAQSGTLTANNTLTVTDVVNVGEGASVEAKNSGLSTSAITNGGTLTTAGAVVASGALTNSGTLNTNNNDVTAGTLTNSGKLETKGDVTAIETLTNSGTLEASKVSAKSLDAQSGTLTANNTLTVTDVVNVGEGASVEAKNSGLSASAITNDGTLTTAGAVVASGALTNSGTLNTNNNDVTAGTLTNSGKLETEGDVTATEKLTNTGTLEASKVSAKSLDAQSGTLTANNTLTVKDVVNVGESASVEAKNSGLSASTITNDGTLTTAGAVVASGALSNSGTLNTNGNNVSANTLTNSGTLEAKDLEANTLVNNSNSTIKVSGNVKANGVLTNNGTLTGVDVGATSLTNNSEIIASGGVSTTDVLTNKGTLKADGDVSAKTLTSGDNSKLTANNVTTVGDINVGNSATITVNDVTSSEGALNVGAGSEITANVVNVAAGVTLEDKSEAKITTVKAESLSVGAEGKLTSDSVTINGAADFGKDATVTVEKSGLSASAITNDGTLTTAGDVTTSGTLRNSGTLNTKGNDVTAAMLTNSGKLDAKDIEATTLVTGVDSKLTAQTLGVTSAEIDGEATVNDAMTATGNVVVNEGAALTAGSVAADALGVEGSLFTDVVKVEEVMNVSKGAEVEVTDSLKADTLINSGTLTGTSVDANVNVNALTNRGTLNIDGNVKTNVLTNSGTADVGALTINDEGVVNANGGSLIADMITANQAIINANGGSVQADTITSNNSTIATNGGTLTANTIFADNLKINAFKDTEKQVVATKLDGNNLIVKVNGLTENQVEIGNYVGKTASVIGSGSVTDSFGSDMPGIEEGMQKLANTLNITGNAEKELVAGQGSVLGEITGKVDTNGTLTVTGEKVNSFNQGVSEMASIALMTWRQENNDMNKRLGELRDSAGEHGVWVRMTRGESKYGAQNIKNQYNAYQLGYDEKLSVDKHWTVGAALTYTDANSSFSGGKGENKHKGLAIYGSRLNDDGSFIDLIARYARLEHDFEVRGGAGKGDFDTNGYSLSAEYGKRFTGKSGLWLEPQVELTYGRVSSANYVTDRGVMVRQDDMDSLVGRLGFALGQNLAKGKGNVYLRASYLYDFEGETDAHFMNATQQNRGFEQDLGGGWWEVGIGANINLSEATHLYFDVEKTYGGNVATPWQWNAGVRWSF